MEPSSQPKINRVQVVISKKNKFIFIHIPKTAGTSIEAALKDDSCMFKRGQWAQKPMGFNAPLNHLTLSQLNQTTDISPEEKQTFFKFTFIRNPWDKVISECFCPHIQLIFKSCSTITEKIKIVCEWAQKNGYGGHCRPQSDFIRDKNLKMDFIGKFENLQKDFHSACAHIGLAPPKLSHLGKTRDKPYAEYYNDETRQMVGEKYAQDIKDFNYKFGE